MKKYESIQTFDTKHHEFWGDTLRAEVWKNDKGDWCTRHFDHFGWAFDMVHEGKSERWAEDAAENYVLRVGF